MRVATTQTTQPLVSSTVLDLSRAIPAQAERALSDGSARMLGKSFLRSHPPVRNPDSFPHFAVQIPGVDVSTTAYLIKGTVYARQERASGGFDVWYDCGKAPQAPAL
jgi:hypothetical protein